MVDVPVGAWQYGVVAGQVTITYKPDEPGHILRIFSQDQPAEIDLSDGAPSTNFSVSTGQLGLELWNAQPFQSPNFQYDTPTITPIENDPTTQTMEWQGRGKAVITNTAAPASKTLTGLTITFFTGQENKDPSTEIVAKLTKSDGTLVAQYGQVLINTPPGTPGFEAPSEFPAWQPTSKQMALQQPTFTNSDTTGLTLTITIIPHGSGPIPIAHDTWTFTWQLVPEWNNAPGTAVTAPAYWSLDEHKTSFASPDPITLA